MSRHLGATALVPFAGYIRHEHLFGQARRDREEVGDDRRQGPGRRPARHHRGACGCAASICRSSPRTSIAATTSSSSMPRRSCFTGKKREKKVYYRHTGYIGGIKERTAKSILEGKFPQRIVEKAVERMLPRGPLGRRQLGNLRVYAGPEHPHAAQNPEPLDIAVAEPQEHEERVTMAETMQSLDQLVRAQAGRTTPRRPKYVQKLDKQGRAYATGKRKNAVARVWVKPGAGKIEINTRPVETYFARPVLRMLIQQPLVASNRQRPVRRRVHGFGRRPVRPGRRGAPRPLQGADGLRAGSARRPQARRLPDAQLARGRAQEVRQGQGAPFVPVLQALIGARSYGCGVRPFPAAAFATAPFAGSMGLARRPASSSHRPCPACH